MAPTLPKGENPSVATMAFLDLATNLCQSMFITFLNYHCFSHVACNVLCLSLCTFWSFPWFQPLFPSEGGNKRFFSFLFVFKVRESACFKEFNPCKNYRGLHRYQWGCPWWLRWKKKKNLPAVQETWVRFLGQEDPLEKGMATYPSIPAWRIPWT